MGDILAFAARTFLGPFVLVFLVGLVLVPLERIFGRAPRAPVIARARLLDLAHWSISGPIGNGLATVATIAALVAWAPLVAFTKIEAKLTGLAFERLPLFAQVIIALVLADFFGYWTHRLFHSVPRLWRFHAVHHSSRRLDWLSAARNHPVGEALGRAIGVLPLVIVGVDPRVLAVIGPVLGLYAIFLHANVPWGFGPLRFVIATPIFHRWHHASTPEARDKNFAGLFPIWDLAFATYYVPSADGRLVEPTSFGIDHELPESFVKQLIDPFSSRSRSASSFSARISST